MLKGRESNVEVNCSNFKSRYKRNNYIALNNRYQDTLGNYNNNDKPLIKN